MKELHPDKKSYIAGANLILQTICCYSCRGHDWTVDKLLWADESHEIKILENGEFSIGCNCCDKETLKGIKTEVEALTQEDIKPFLGGVSILFHGFYLECAKCGSEEFIIPE